jgi:hypothetical protein
MSTVLVGSPGELRLIERHQPALGDPVAAQSVEADRRPLACASCDHGGPIRECREVLALADEELPPVHPEGPVGEVAAAEHVGDHVLDALVIARYRRSPRDVPDDIGTEQEAHRIDGPARIEPLLGSVERLHEFHCALALHARSYRRALSPPPQRRGATSAARPYPLASPMPR